MVALRSSPGIAARSVSIVLIIQNHSFGCERVPSEVLLTLKYHASGLGFEKKADPRLVCCEMRLPQMTSGNAWRLARLPTNRQKLLRRLSATMPPC